MKVFENKEVREIFGPKKCAVSVGCKNIHNRDRDDSLFCSSYATVRRTGRLTMSCKTGTDRKRETYPEVMKIDCFGEGKRRKRNQNRS